MNWPWNRGPRPAKAGRIEADAYAEKVHREVTLPLREMRAKNHMTDAVISDIRRNLMRGAG